MAHAAFQAPFAEIVGKMLDRATNSEGTEEGFKAAIETLMLSYAAKHMVNVEDSVRFGDNDPTVISLSVDRDAVQ